MIRFLFKITALPLFYLVSILPFWIIYPVSDLVYYFGYYILAYRKQVVLINLRNSFPEKSEAEIKTISKQFYKHFCDVLFETIKLLTISPKQFKKRCQYEPASLKLLEDFFAKKQSIVGVMGHCGNWEWAAIAHQFYFQSRITGIYHPLSNKSFDEFMLKLRSRKGGHIIPMKVVHRELIRLREQNIPTTIGLISDQAPPPESAYWTKFMHQDTAFFLGPEKIAKKFNYPLVYLGVHKVKRGHYLLKATLISDRPANSSEGEITLGHVAQLEKDLNEQPFNWLWTHRRWKHKKQVNPPLKH